MGGGGGGFGKKGQNWKIMVGPAIDIYRETDHRYLKLHLDYIDRVLGESAVHTLAENKKPLWLYVSKL